MSAQFRTSYGWTIAARLVALSTEVTLKGTVSVTGSYVEDLDTPQVRRAVAVIGWRSALEALGTLEKFDPVFLTTFDPVPTLEVFRSYFDDNTPGSPKNTVESSPWGRWRRNHDAGPECAAFDVLAAFDGFSTFDASFDINGADHESGTVSAQTDLTPSGFIRSPWWQVKTWRAAEAVEQAARAEGGDDPAFPFWAELYKKPEPSGAWGKKATETEEERQARLLHEWQERDAEIDRLAAANWGKDEALCTDEERAARAEWSRLMALQNENEVARGC